MKPLKWIKARTQVRFILILVLFNLFLILLVFPIEIFTYITNNAEKNRRASVLQKAWEQVISDELNLINIIKWKQHTSEDSYSEQTHSSQTHYVSPTDTEINHLRTAHQNNQKYFFSRRNNHLILWPVLDDVSDLGHTLGLIINEHRIQKYSRLLQLELEIDSTLSQPEKIASREFEQKLSDQKGKPIARIYSKTTGSNSVQSTGPYVRLTFFILSMSFLATVSLLYTWTIRPIQKILNAIHAKKPEELASIQNSTGEISELAKLVNYFFIQKSDLEQEIELRDIAESSLKTREHQLETLLADREVLYRDLHDEIIQTLFALGLHIDLQMRHLAHKQYGGHNIQTELFQSKEMVNSVIQQLRSYLERNETPTEQVYPLKEKLIQLTQRMNKLSSAAVNLNLSENGLETIGISLGHDIVAMCTEAISNSIRHGAATRIDIQITIENKRVSLSITDDGSGCDPAAIEIGHGIANMKKRVANQSGTIKIISSATNGFEIHAVFTNNRPISKS